MQFYVFNREGDRESKITDCSCKYLEVFYYNAQFNIEKADGKDARVTIPALHLRHRELHKVSLLLQLGHERFNDAFLVLEGFLKKLVPAGHKLRI